MFTWWVFYDLQPGDEVMFIIEPIAIGVVYFLMIKNEIEMFFTHKKYYPTKYVSPDKYISKVFRLHKKKIPKFLYIQAWKCIALWFLWIPNLCIWEYLIVT